MAPEKTQKSNIFTQEEIKNFVALGDTLRRIHARLISEEYVIRKGHITKRKTK